MSDLPQWAKGDEEGGGNTDLEDKLVDEAKPNEPESSNVEVEADEAPDQIDSGSRVLFFFRFVAALTVIMALVLIATNCYIIYKSYDDLQVRGVTLRVYGILFCLFVIFAELELGHFMKFFGFLKYWPARGVFYVFVGLITWDETDDTDNTFETYEDVVAFIMIALGVLYFILGLACMRTVKEAESARLAEEAANP